MCEKQCRDQNGFKCHCMSEGHQRQMQIFGQNPNNFIEDFSEKFENSFLEHMKRSHRFSRIAATVVYSEYIRDKSHVHVNSTRWLPLTEFVKYLGRTSKCKVENTPMGWFITYIDRDSETLFRYRMKNKRIKKSGMAEEEKQEEEIQKESQKTELLMMMQPSTIGSDQPSQAELPGELKVEDGIKVGFSLGSSAKPTTREKLEGPKVVFDKAKNEERNPVGALERKSTLNELIEKKQKKDYWLHEGIVVKVMSKALADKGYYKQKGVVPKVINKYVGELEMLESKHVHRVDQAELETVIPKISCLVKIVNGAYSQIARG